MRIPIWIIDRPAAGAEVVLEGLSADGVERFELPQLRVLADYAVGPRRGTLELKPHTLVLLADERRLYLVYRAGFRVGYEPGLERGFRLRLLDGWFQKEAA